MKNISIIIPFYNGEKYINQLSKSLYDAIHIYKKKQMGDIEVIIVNDNPSDLNDIETLFTNKNLHIQLVQNINNVGIQQSRINGLINAKYEYILFLDQDDIILENYFLHQMNNINDFDVVISNGINEYANYNKDIYKTKRSQRFATKEIGYIMVRDLIVSPGQCIIKKESIPTYWCSHIMNINCADDYFLWLLMFNNHKKFTLNYSKDYIHKYTGSNISENMDHVNKSNYEMIELLRIDKTYSKIKLKLLKRTVDYKYDIFKGRLINSTIKNIDLFIFNCLYQILWKGM